MVFNLKLRTYLAAGVVCGAVALFGFVVWRAAIMEKSVPSFVDLPVIKAPSGPARVPPESPGGLQVPHQDKTVFDTFKTGEKMKRVEILLPRPDTPLEPSKLAITKGSSRNMRGNLATDPLDVEAGVAIAIEPTSKYEVRSPAVVNGDIAALVRGSSGEGTAERSLESPASRLTLNSTYFVQLASLRTLDAAEAAWGKLFTRAPRLLAGLSPIIVKVDLVEGGGTFYRLQVGTLPNRDAAAALCNALAAVALDCLIVRP
ncbi:MAG TPA: SPOR domain-containing protein [Alphaproteobacteria bacterium]|nr:SPOR domain-containing protein [Alphaproteobacteria bacterium]